MMHGLNNMYLYAAKKIISRWTNGQEQVELRGTGFFIGKNNTYYLVTNRHVVEPSYYAAEYKSFTVSEFLVESFEDTDTTGLPVSSKTTSIANWSEFKFHKNDHNDIACLKDPKAVGGITIIAPIKR